MMSRPGLLRQAANWSGMKPSGRRICCRTAKHCQPSNWRPSDEMLYHSSVPDVIPVALPTADSAYAAAKYSKCRMPVDAEFPWADECAEGGDGQLEEDGREGHDAGGQCGANGADAPRA